MLMKIDFNKKREMLKAVVISIAGIGLIHGLTQHAKFEEYLWKIRYGRTQDFGGVTIEIGRSEYFLPRSDKQESLFILHGDSRSLVVLRAGQRDARDMKQFLVQLCRIEGCIDFTEKVHGSPGARATSFTFSTFDKSAKSLHQYTTVEGANAWFEFSGDFHSYAARRATLETIVSSLARRQGQVGQSARSPGHVEVGSPSVAD